MSKYIITNCPAYDYEEEFNYHICKQPLVPYECSVDDCRERTDCVLKRIVNELNIIECGQYNNNKCELNGFDCCEGESKRKILQLLEIEEVDER